MSNQNNAPTLDRAKKINPDFVRRWEIFSQIGDFSQFLLIPENAQEWKKIVAKHQEEESTAIALREKEEYENFFFSEVKNGNYDLVTVENFHLLEGKIAPEKVSVILQYLNVRQGSYLLQQNTEILQQGAEIVKKQDQAANTLQGAVNALDDIRSQNQQVIRQIEQQAARRLEMDADRLYSDPRNVVRNRLLIPTGKKFTRLEIEQKLRDKLSPNQIFG